MLGMFSRKFRWLLSCFFLSLKVVFLFIELVIYKCNLQCLSNCLFNDQPLDSKENFLSWNYTIVL